MWGTYIALIPLYLGSSGDLQIADLALGLTLALHLLGAGTHRLDVHRQVVLPLQAAFAFAGYTLLVGAWWTLVLLDTEPLRYSRYYVYGVGIIALVCMLHRRFGDRFLQATRWALYLGLFWVAVAVLLDPAPGLRSSGPFNNPNQLGFYALLSQSCLWVVNSVRPLRELSALRAAPYVEAAAWAASALLVLASSSLGATAGVVLLFVLTLLGRRRVTMQVVVAALLLLPLIATSPGETPFETVQMRYDRQVDRADGEVGSVLEERGYDRMVHHPHHLLLGAAEGRTDRFPESYYHGEIHSSPGTLLFSYGLVGLGLFGLFALRTVHGVGLITSLPLLPVLAYSLSHNGLRFRPWWVLLGLLVALAATEAARRGRRSGGDRRPTQSTLPEDSR